MNTTTNELTTTAPREIHWQLPTSIPLNIDPFRNFNLLDMRQFSQKVASLTDSLSNLQSPISHDADHNEESLYMEEKIRPEQKFEGIIGRS